MRKKTSCLLVYHNNMILLFSSSVDYQMVSLSRVNWLLLFLHFRSLSLSVFLAAVYLLCSDPIYCVYGHRHWLHIDQCLIYTSLRSIVNRVNWLIRRQRTSMTNCQTLLTDDQMRLSCSCRIFIWNCIFKRQMYTVIRPCFNKSTISSSSDVTHVQKCTEKTKEKIKKKNKWIKK